MLEPNKGMYSGIELPFQGLADAVEFLFTLARKDEQKYQDYRHVCQNSSIALELILQHFDPNATVVLLDFQQDFRETMGRFSSNMVHYVVSSGDCFADASPNLYMHQQLGLDGGIVLSPENPMGDLYERYIAAKEFGERHDEWGGLSIASIRETHTGGELLIDRNEKEVQEFIERLQVSYGS